MLLASIAILAISLPQDPTAQGDLDADLAQIGHRDRATAAAACARVFARGEAALPALFERWEERPTRPARNVGKPEFERTIAPFDLLLDPAGSLQPKSRSYLHPDELATSIRISDLPLPTVDETVAALIALTAPGSVDATEVLLEATMETRQHSVLAWSVIPPLARTCAKLLRHYPNLDLDAVLRAARRGSWAAGAVLLSLGDEGVALLRSQPHLVTNAYLALAGDPRDAKRMGYGLKSRETAHLVAPWFVRAGDDALTPLIMACQMVDTAEQAIAFAMLGSRGATSATSRRHLLELTRADHPTTRTLAWMALGAGAVSPEERSLVAEAIDRVLERDTEFKRDDTRAAWCAGIALGCLEPAVAAKGWSTLLSSKECATAKWAAVAAAARGELPVDGAWTKGPDAAAVAAAQVDSSRLWEQIAGGDDPRRVKACRAAARVHPEHRAAIVMMEYAIRMKPEFPNDTWNSALGLGGGAGGMFRADPKRDFADLASPSEERRAGAAERLASRAHLLTRERLEALGQALDDEAALVRRSLLDGLSAAAGPVELPFMERVLTAAQNDTAATVRAAAMAAIWRHAAEEPSSIQALTRGTGDPDPRVRSAAARVVFAEDIATILQAKGWLQSLLTDSDAEVRLALAVGLGEKQRCETALEAGTWTGLLASSQPPWLRARAIHALGRNAEERLDSETAPALVALLEQAAVDPTLSERAQSAARSSWIKMTDNDLLRAIDRIEWAIRGGFSQYSFGW